MAEAARGGGSKIGVVGGYLRARTGGAVPDAAIRTGQHGRPADPLQLEALAGRPPSQRFPLANAVPEQPGRGGRPVPQHALRHLLDQTFLRTRSQDLPHLRLPQRPRRVQRVHPQFRPHFKVQRQGEGQSSRPTGPSFFILLSSVKSIDI